MGSGFLTLGVSIDVVLCPGCQTLSDWCVVHSNDGDVQWFSERMSWLVQQRLWCKEKGLSSAPAWLSVVGSQCLRHWERWLSLACRQVAAHVQSFRSPCTCRSRTVGSLKSQGFRRQCEGFCQARAPFAASHPVSRSASKLVAYSQLGCWGSAH